MKLPWNKKRGEKRSLISISDPLLLTLLGRGPENFSGIDVTEETALALSAVYRATSLISGSLGMLPMRSLRDIGDDQRARVSSFLDRPGGPDANWGPTPFEWKERILLHMLLHGDAFLYHIYGGGGQLLALTPIHPQNVNVEWADVPGGKRFTTSMLLDVKTNTLTTLDLDSRYMTQIMGMSLDGLRGLSVVSLARSSFGTAIAGDRAAAKMFSNGALISGLVSADGEELEQDEAKIVKEELQQRTTGWQNAGDIAFINRNLKFTPWTLSAEDAQFLQSRSFQIEEIARWFGVPPHLLMQTEKQTSWGTGVAEQNRGLNRTVLAPWATRIEQRLSRLLPNPRFVEFDFSGLERPTPETEVDLLNKKVDGGLMTVNEARRVLNLPPVEGGDILRYKGTPILTKIADPILVS